MIYGYLLTTTQDNHIYALYYQRLGGEVHSKKPQEDVASSEYLYDDDEEDNASDHDNHLDFKKLSHDMANFGQHSDDDESHALSSYHDLDPKKLEEDSANSDSSFDENNESHASVSYHDLDTNKLEDDIAKSAPSLDLDQSNVPAFDNGLDIHKLDHDIVSAFAYCLAPSCCFHACVCLPCICFHISLSHAYS